MAKTYDPNNSVATPGVTTVGTGPSSVATPSLEPQAPKYGGADPNQDASYLAYLRGAGLNEAQARAQVAKQRTTLTAGLEAQRPMWAQTLQQGMRNATTNAAGRGTVRSSNRLDNQNEVQTAVQQQQANAEAGVAGQLSGLDDQLQNVLLQSQVGRANAAAEAQQRAFQSNAETYGAQLQQYYLQQLLGGAQ